MSMPPPGPPPASPPPPQPAPDDLGWLRLTLQGSVLTSNMITPAVSVNGYRVPAQYGDNVIPVHAGPNRVDVSCQWLMTYGQATLETQVPPGGQVAVYYAAPLHQFSRGAIGFERQKRPGVLGFWLLLGVIVLVVLALVILPNL
jgi:hypothetical protein